MHIEIPSPLPLHTHTNVHTHTLIHSATHTHTYTHTQEREFVWLRATCFASARRVYVGVCSQWGLKSLWRWSLTGPPAAWAGCPQGIFHNHRPLPGTSLHRAQWQRECVYVSVCVCVCVCMCVRARVCECIPTRRCVCIWVVRACLCWSMCVHVYVC